MEEASENRLDRAPAALPNLVPVGQLISKDQFDLLVGRVDDLFDKFFQEQGKTSTTKETVTQLERKMGHVEGNLLPDLKLRIKTVKKSIPAEVSLPVKNKEILEQVRAGLERARAKITVLEQPKTDQKFKLSESSIAALFGK